MNRDLHRAITETILAQIAAKPDAWTCPWSRPRGGLPRNAQTRRAYRGINILALWCAEQAHGHPTSTWATYRQWTQLGAQVRRGAKGTVVLFYKDLPPNEVSACGGDGNGAPVEHASSWRFVARASWVFNAAQVEGAPDLDAGFPSLDLPEPMPAFDRFVAATKAIIRESDRASYLPGPDETRMPPRRLFQSPEGYAATLAHELVHWTGHPARLARDLTGRFGTAFYAAEELVAELGAAFTLAGLGLAPLPHPNHAAYVEHWLPLVRADPRALATAAALASRAADYLQALQGGSDA